MENTNTSWEKTDPYKFISIHQESVLVGSTLDIDCIRIGRLQGDIVNNCPIMFCGGPVTSMSWCNAVSPDSSQVLAVAVKNNFHPSKLGERKKSPGMIQFWKVVPGQKPEFEFGLCHNYGDVWCLEWCPSISRDDDKTTGIIGASCGDGTVRIWSVPKLLTTGACYLKEADLTLTHDDPDIGQCLSLSWFRGPGHEYVAACFSSGIVSVWHLTTTSPLLRQDDTTLLPVYTWLAHTGSTVSVSLCPSVDTEPRYLVTGGSDRSYKFWDLRDTCVPVQEVQRGLVTDVKWITGWTGAGVCYDDVYRQSHTQSLLAEIGYHASRSHPIISQNSAVTSMSLSQWLNVMAVCTSAGELIIFVLPSLHKSLEHDKNMAQRRSYVYWTEASHKDIVGVDSERLYETVSDTTKLLYHDTSLKRSESSKLSQSQDDTKKVRSSDSMNIEDLSCYPVAGLTSVSWNNNPGQHTLVASGGHSGIVRCHNLTCLNTPDVVKELKIVELL